MPVENRYRWGKKFLAILIMIGVLVIVWSPLLKNGFLTKWDDQWMVLENPHLIEVNNHNTVSFETVFTIFSEPYNGQYSPLNTLAYVIIVKQWGIEPLGFHLFFLIIHLLNFLLVGFIIQKLLHLIPAVDLQDTAIMGIAWATAFLFAIHPIQVEAVAWVSASKIPLYSFFFLLGIYVYLLYKQNKKNFLWGLVLLCFMISLLAKKEAVVFIGALVVVDLSITRGNSKNGVANWLTRITWLDKIPFLIIGLLFTLLTFSIEDLSIIDNSYSLKHRLMFAHYSFWEYLIKLAAPYNLSYFYFFPIDPGESIPLRFWFYPIFMGVFLWMIYEYRQKINRVYLFGGGFFLVNIALSLHLLYTPMATIMADRYVYLSSIGIFLIVIFTVVQWLSKREGISKQIVLVISGIVLLIFGGLTHERTKMWYDMETIQQDVEHITLRHLGKNPMEVINTLSCPDLSTTREQNEDNLP